MKQVANREPRMWPGAVELTEAEGRALETARLWSRAESDPKLWAELEARGLILDGVTAASEGEQSLMEFAYHMDLTAREAVAFRMVAGFLKRQVKEARQNRKQAQREAQAEAKAKRDGEAKP